MRSFKLTAIAVLCLLLSGSAYSKILRLGYWGNQIAGVDFATADLAVTAATGGTASTTGDTILVYGRSGSTTWNFNNLNKKLVILGSGYFHYSSTGWTNFNANLQNYQPHSLVAIQFAAGSDGSQVSGCQFPNNLWVYGDGVTGLNNIKISNCYFTSPIYFTNFTYNNWEFSKCFFQSYIYGSYSSGKLTNLKVFNCIFYGAGSSIELSPTAGQFGIIENCSFIDGNLSLNSHSFIVQNCIFSHTYSITNYSASVFNHCVCDNAPVPALQGVNNVLSVNGANLYAGFPTQDIYSPDERFKLKAGSPAIGVGVSNVDCGAFGGVNPYKLSGIPAIPAIYKLTAPGSSANTNPYTITFSVRSNN